MATLDDDLRQEVDTLFETLIIPNNTDEVYCDVLKEIADFLQDKRNHDSVNLVATNAERFVPTIISLLAHKNLQVADAARQVLEAVQTIAPSSLFNESSVVAFHTLCQGSSEISKILSSFASAETIRIRVYELLLHIASRSSDALKAIDHAALLKTYFDELSIAVGDSTRCDLLVALNLVQLLGDFAATQHGIEYLDSPPRNILSKLNEKLRSTLSETERLSDPLLSFFWPALLKFFASIARFNCNWLFDRQTLFWDSLKTAIIEPIDSSVKLTAIETLGWVFEPRKNKLVANHRWHKELAACIHELCQALVGRQKVDSEILVRTAECLTRLLEVQDETGEELTDAKIIAESQQVVAEWLVTLLGGRDFVAALFEVIRRQAPSEPLRIALFGMFCAISSTSDGIGLQLMRDCAGLAEYLIDRSTESGSSADAKRAKFDVVAALVHRREIALRVFDGPVVVKLMKFVADGPFYAQAEVQVDLEAPR